MAISLSSLNRLSVPKPPRIVIYGPHGIGKNTFAGAAPHPMVAHVMARHARRRVRSWGDPRSPTPH